MIDRVSSTSHSSENYLSTSQDRKLPIYCPNCSQQIQVTKGLCGNRLIDAILLQAQRVGAELHCQRCQHTFVYFQVESLGQSTGSGSPAYSHGKMSP